MDGANQDLFHTNSDGDELSATFWEHIDALRRMLICVLCIVIAGVSLCLYFYTPLLQFILAPLEPQKTALQTYEIKHRHIINSSDRTLSYDLPNTNYTVVNHSPDVQQMSATTYNLPKGGSVEVTSSEPSTPLALLSPLEGMKTTLKVCFWMGLVLTSPFWLFFIIQFIIPAIKRSQRRLLLPFLALSLVFLSTGALFAKHITLPLANEMLYSFNAEIGMNIWSYASYVDYTLLLMLANALAFEITLVLFFCVHIGLMTPEFMQSKRRAMILTAFIVGALLTPPDVLTQIMLAIPLIGMYELALIYARLRQSFATRTPQTSNFKPLI
jgi:sec-independent protein translocase protein TatC